MWVSGGHIAGPPPEPSRVRHQAGSLHARRSAKGELMLKRPAWSAGRVVVLEHVSKVLKGNPLGDPHVRKLAVWLPPQYDQAVGRGRGKRFAVLVDLVGFTGSGMSHVAWKSFSENVPERAARRIFDGKMAPAIIVFPDCF